jgi:putative NADH-flavin reductase
MGAFADALVDSAVASGHAVSVFARDPSKLTCPRSEKVALFRGDAETGEGLAPAVAGCDCVVSAFDPQRPVFMTNLLDLLVAPALKRFVLVSRLGVGNTLEQAKNASGFLTALAPRAQRQLYEEYSQAEGLLRTSPLCYLILRVAALDPETAGQEVITTDADVPPPSRIAPVDLAKFIVRVLEEPGWERREVTVGTLRRAPRGA